VPFSECFEGRLNFATAVRHNSASTNLSAPVFVEVVSDVRELRMIERQNVSEERIRDDPLLPALIHQIDHGDCAVPRQLAVEMSLERGAVRRLVCTTKQKRLSLSAALSHFLDKYRDGRPAKGRHQCQYY